MREIKNKIILVTGCCGTVGQELVSQLLNMPKSEGPIRIIGIDNNESQIFFQDQEWLNEDRVSFFIGDVRDLQLLRAQMKGIHIVFHCAALKHVVLCERSPNQAIQTNINGVENIVVAAEENNVEVVIFTSSDKAVNPTNVMGTSKLMGERLITAANSCKRVGGPVFASTRFGNVLGSSGSVVPIFKGQIAKGGPVTLTHSDMSRFVMSIGESVQLIIDSALQAKGGEVFVTKMPVLNIKDLAIALTQELADKHGHVADDIEIVEIGTKPGEKLYEELMSDEETRRAIELPKYFAILPAFRGMYSEVDYTYPSIVNDHVTHPYNSANEPSLSIEDIRELLHRYDLLGTDANSSLSRYWAGDKESLMERK
jgi:FlaA1/EpsC-like NDP-sugar epimerase